MNPALRTTTVPEQLTKMGPEADPEDFFVTFEWVATVAHREVAILLIPYLMGAAQASYLGLDVETAQDYAKVKAAMLDYLDIMEETSQPVVQRGKVSPESLVSCECSEIEGAMLDTAEAGNLYRHSGH